MRDRHAATSDTVLSDLSATTIGAHLKPIVARDAVLVTDGNRAYEAFAAETGITCEVFNKDQLEAMGCGGMLGVNRGSTEPPRMVRLTYTPKNPTGHLALVGKLLKRTGSRILAVMDAGLEKGQAVTVFLPGYTHVAEVTRCTRQAERFRIELHVGL